MKRSICLSLLVLTGSILFSSCTKNDDSGGQESIEQVIAQNATTIDLSKCKIRRIYQDQLDQRVSALFSYNRAGNPYSLLYSNGGTGVRNHYFFYDASNRLVEYHQNWGGYVITYHYYKHNAMGQIISDSAVFGDCCGRFDYETVSDIEYDALGRVVKETIRNVKNAEGPLDRTRRPTYTYDNRGNLGVIGWKSSSYDNKINPLRQSPVFQFIMRNYSMNNAAPQPKYNSLGLPLSMYPSNDAFFNSSATFKVVYDCQ